MHQDFSLYEFAIFLSFSQLLFWPWEDSKLFLEAKFCKVIIFCRPFARPIGQRRPLFEKSEILHCKKRDGKNWPRCTEKIFSSLKGWTFCKDPSSTTVPLLCPRNLQWNSTLKFEILAVGYYCPHRSPLYPWIRLLCLFRNPKSKWEMAFEGKLRTLHWTARKVGQTMWIPCLCVYVRDLKQSFL